MLNDLQERHFYFVKDCFYDRLNDGQLITREGTIRDLATVLRLKGILPGLFPLLPSLRLLRGCMTDALKSMEGAILWFSVGSEGSAAV